jgi:hypothetical protein
MDSSASAEVGNTTSLLPPATAASALSGGIVTEVSGKEAIRLACLVTDDNYRYPSISTRAEHPLPWWRPRSGVKVA